MIDEKAFKKLSVGISPTNMNVIRGFLEIYEAEKSTKPETSKDEIEIVAMAICGLRYDKYEQKNTQCKSEYIGYLWTHWIDEAKAAIAAMRSPKPVMDVEQIRHALECSRIFAIKNCDKLNAGFVISAIDEARAIISSFPKQESK